uniref:DUF721 domain-containing protein n=1 Tax=Candidatus Caldatribacterium californiense TaxID=1454726 RepID=A0A7V3YMH5_9BACT
MSRPSPLSEALAEFLKRQGLLPRVQVYQAMERFGEWFPDLAAVCTPKKVVRNVLFLEVTDPVCLLEVEGRAREILETFQRQGIPLEAVKIRVCPRGDGK